MKSAANPPEVSPAAARHDAYAADYDSQVRAYDCYIAEVLFGLSYEFVRPGDRALDLGIGSGVSAAPFARAGLRVCGMDFSPPMLAVCRAKGIASELRLHDLQNIPWPYPTGIFDHVICCGVLHFIPDLEPIFDETARVLRPGGMFAFTTKSPTAPDTQGQPYVSVTAGGLDVFSHSPAYLEALIERGRFDRLKALKCFRVCFK